MTVELEVILNNPQAKEKFINAVKEGVSLLHQIDGLKEDIKDIANFLKEEYDLATKDFNQTIKHVYKDEIEEELEYLAMIEQAVSVVKGSDEED